MSERVYRYDIVGTVVPAQEAKEECPVCGLELDQNGKCLDRCDEALVPYRQKQERLG